MNLGDGTAADILDRTDGVGVITFVGRTVITGVGYHLSVVRGHLRDTVCLEARLDLTGDELRSLRRFEDLTLCLGDGRRVPFRIVTDDGPIELMGLPRA
jgi:hypothetical protein